MKQSLCYKVHNLQKYLNVANNKIDDLEDIDCCVFISTNPRYESANINLRLRKIFRRGCLDLWSLGFFPAAMFKVNFFHIPSQSKDAFS